MYYMCNRHIWILLLYIYGWWFILGIIIPTDPEHPNGPVAVPGTAERRASVHCGSEDSCGFGHGEDVQSFRIFHRENIWEMIEMGG